MKFDSYTRFLKSLLYQECMLAEVEGRPLPDPYHIPSSPTSKHSTTGSDRSNLSTPKKVKQRYDLGIGKERTVVKLASGSLGSLRLPPIPFIFRRRRTKKASRAGR